MKIYKNVLLFLFVFISSASFAQVGIGTTTPKTTLQVKGDPANPYRADGIQIPTLSLAQLNAKSSYVYNYHQDGALIYVNNVSGSTGSATAGITTKGFYYYDSSINKFKMVGDSPNTTPTTYSVGDFTQGGVVFWVDETSQHGLVAATFDQSSGIHWGYNNYYEQKIIRNGIYAGMLNTERIISNQQTSSSKAANISIIHYGGNYGDWYLPSRYELKLLYQQKATVGNLANTYYWTSNMGSFNKAFARHFGSGSGGKFDKESNFRVRAIRRF